MRSRTGGAAAGDDPQSLGVQNIVLLFAEVSGTSWMTSQCSTIFPSSTRKRSTIAWPRSPGAFTKWARTATRLPSVSTCLSVTVRCGIGAGRSCVHLPGPDAVGTCYATPMSVSHWIAVRGARPSSFWADRSGVIERSGSARMAW